jgi:hypothetical protein
VTWKRLLVVALLGAAMLLFRASHNCPDIRPDFQDTRGDLASAHLDDGTPLITPIVCPEPSLLEVRRFRGERPDALADHLFVSEIFRPPIAPLARI